MHLEFDAGYARRMLEMPGLETWWKDQARQKIEGSSRALDLDHEKRRQMILSHRNG
jgi:hypothetical protein